MGISSLRKNSYGHNLWLSGSDEYLDGYNMYGADMHHIAFIRQNMSEQASTVKVVPCTAEKMEVNYVDADITDIITSTPAIYIVSNADTVIEAKIPFVPVNTRIVTDFEIGENSFYNPQESKLYIYDKAGSLKAGFVLCDRIGRPFNSASENIPTEKMVSGFVISNIGIMQEFADDFTLADKLRSGGERSYAISEKDISRFGAAFRGKEVRVFARGMKDIDLYLFAEKEKNVILLPKSYEISKAYKTGDIASCGMRTYLGSDIYDSMRNNSSLKGVYRGSHEFYIGISSDNGNIYTGDYLRSGKFTFVICDPRITDILPDGGSLILTGKDSKHVGTVIRTGYRTITRNVSENGNVAWVGIDNDGNKYPIPVIDNKGEDFKPSERAVFKGTSFNNYIGLPSDKEIMDILETQTALLDGSAIFVYEKRRDANNANIIGKSKTSRATQTLTLK